MSFKFHDKRVNKRLQKTVESLLKTRDLDGNLRITQVGEVVLRQKCPQFVGDITEDLLRKLIAAMKKTMRNAPGVGLAAPQIGLNMNLAVIEDPTGADDEFGGNNVEIDERETKYTPFYVILNPVYYPVDNEGNVIYNATNSAETSANTKSTQNQYGSPQNATNPPKNCETRKFYEGCLSFDGYYGVRERYYKILAKWQDEKGRDHEEIMQGWPARIFQHETDHLSGEIYIDKAILRSVTSTDNLTNFALDSDLEFTADEFGFAL